MTWLLSKAVEEQIPLVLNCPFYGALLQPPLEINVGTMDILTCALCKSVQEGIQKYTNVYKMEFEKKILTQKNT